MDDLKAHGVQVNTVDQAPFRALVGPVYDKYSKVWGAPLVDAIRKAAAAA